MSRLLALAACLVLTNAPRQKTPSLASPTDVRLEHFVLELRDGASTEPGSPAREVGLVCLRRRTLYADKGHAARGGEAGMQLEAECLFRRDAGADDAEHVLHVERLTSEGPRLVWREWGPGRARCLTADWSQDGGGLHMVESCRGGMPRETLSAGDGAVMPLYLLELARSGGATAGRYRRLDPLSRELETIDLATSYRAESGVRYRIVDMVREDGSLAGHFEFRGTDLVSFQWQEGELVARRVSAEDYDQRSVGAAPVATIERP